MAGVLSKEVVDRYQVYIRNCHGDLVAYGGSGYACPMSTFYKSPFMYRGQDFLYAENAINWAKAKLFEDVETADNIVNSARFWPKTAKALGNVVKGYRKPVWREYLAKELAEIMYAKFSQNETLKKWLLETGSARLADVAMEDSNGRAWTNDDMWGLTLSPSSPDILRPDVWYIYGNNVLGQTVEMVRERIREEEARKNHCCVTNC